MAVNNSGRLALTGVMTALAVAFLCLTATPIATVGTAALAGLCGIPVVIETGQRGGLLHFIAVTVLAWLLVPSAEGNGLYTVFIGWYTVFKAWLEQRNLSRPAEWGIKCGALATALAIYVAVWVFLLKMPSPTGDGTTILIVAVILCVLFVVYDRCMTGLVTLYHRRLRPSMRRWFRF